MGREFSISLADKGFPSQGVKSHVPEPITLPRSRDVIPGQLRPIIFAHFKTALPLAPPTRTSGLPSDSLLIIHSQPGFHINKSLSQLATTINSSSSLSKQAKAIVTLYFCIYIKLYVVSIYHIYISSSVCFKQDLQYHPRYLYSPSSRGYQAGINPHPILIQLVASSMFRYKLVAVGGIIISFRYTCSLWEKRQLVDWSPKLFLKLTYTAYYEQLLDMNG